MENATYPDCEGYSTYDTEHEENINPSVVLMIQILEVIWYIITFLLGIIGNGLVIWIAGIKMKKTVSILWFLNLAIADFVFVITLPLQITKSIMGGHWPFGQTMCKVIFTVFFLNMSVRPFFLMIISIHRCISIMCPVWSKNHKCPRLVSSISYIVWTICFMLSSPYLAILDVVHDSQNSSSYCIPLYADDGDIGLERQQAMMTLRLISTFLIPFVIIVTCYSLIAFQLRRSRSLSRSNRLLKVITTIVLCFVCFWFPFHTWPFLQNAGISATVDLIMSNLIYCIAIFNSCVNPIVYVFVGRDIKKIAFKSIPLLLENTLKEKDESETGARFNQSMMGTEMENYNFSGVVLSE